MAINVNPGSPLRHVATFNATGNWTAPAGTNLAFVSIHSASAGGGAFGGRYLRDDGRYNAAAGGTGSVSGAYVQVTPGSSHAVTIGAGGAGAVVTGSGNNRTAQAAGTGGVTIFDSAFTANGSQGGSNNASRYSNGSTGAAASAATGTTTLTTVNPGSSTLTRVGTISNQNTGGRAGGTGGTSGGDQRYGTANAGGAGLSGIVHVYI